MFSDRLRYVASMDLKVWATKLAKLMISLSKKQNGETMDSKKSDVLKMDYKEKYIVELLKYMNYPSYISGFIYVKEAILYCLANGTETNITDYLHPVLAEQFGVTPAKVERSIHYGIRKTFKKPNLALKLVFGDEYNYRKAKPSNSEFIITVTEYIEKELL